jgi:phosphoserine phosphatase
VKRFNSVVFDVDSTLSDVEGIDWLASLRGPQVEEWSAALTAKAMEGIVPIEAIYGERLLLVKPTLAEIRELAATYISRMAPMVREVFSSLRAHDVGIAMVSGGFRQAILPLAEALEVAEEHLAAVSLFFDAAGEYSGFEEDSPLTRQKGKRTAVREMNLVSPVLAVGDGMTDLEMKPVANAFAAFTGFVRREHIVERADYVLSSFDQLETLVLG